MMNPNFSIRSEGAVHHIKWKVYPVDRRTYGGIAQWVMRSTDYTPMNKGKMIYLTQLVGDLNGLYGGAVTIEQAVAIRNIILKSKIIKNYHRMNSVIRKVSREYDGGLSIMSLSATYDFPPLNLLRGIFLHKGYDSGKVHAIFTSKRDLSYLKGRDLAQFVIAEANDAESTFNQQIVTEIAAENEIRFVKFFADLGIGHRTQDDLVTEQTAQFGRAVITPDLLFTDTVFINGARVHWIDYKDYIGTNVGFLLKSNTEQAAKYTVKWGPGAMCYHKSFVDDVKIGALMLDTSALSIELL